MRSTWRLLGVFLVFFSQALWAEGDPEAGKKAVAVCRACHSFAKGEVKIGPSLFGVYGRKAADLESFPRYSEAFKGLSVTWDEATLLEFLGSPGSYAPGTSMVYPGVKQEAKRQHIIAYLKTLQ